MVGNDGWWWRLLLMVSGLLGGGRLAMAGGSGWLTEA